MGSERSVVTLPAVIQGGMGVAVSGWRLAHAVAVAGGLGVVSGTALDVVHARRLGDGDAGGHLRRAYGAFPVPGVAERVLQRWFCSAGRSPSERYRGVPMARVASPRSLRELTLLANFAEVWLAKEGHDGPIGVNYLEKIQIPTPDATYGAMLAGVDCVLMGAGIPASMPQLLTDLAAGRPVSYRVNVVDPASDEVIAVTFDPAELFDPAPPTLARPAFIAIVSSATLAAFLSKNVATRPDGFVVEAPRAGGHNAPPRGRLRLDATGQPVYGARDEVDLSAIAATGLPFWLAGGYASPDRAEAARRCGAEGVQVGTAFALCDESGLRDDLKEQLIRSARAGTLEVHTDPVASPSGYPFKVARVPGTVSDDAVYEARQRICDLGFLRTAYRKPDGTIGYRCPSEPVEAYLAKGGQLADTVGRRCLCNGLLAAAGMPQQRHDAAEPAIVTAGDDITRVVEALGGHDGRWSAADVVAHVLGSSTDGDDESGSR